MLRVDAAALPGRLLRATWLGNILGALVWLNLLRLQFLQADRSLTIANALTIILTTSIIILFLVRRDAQRTGSLPELLLALAGSFVTLLLPSVGPANWSGSALEIAGSLLGLAALLELGDSFGLAPADRGLKQRGVYAIIRHPLYASELLFFAGYFLIQPSPRAGVIIAVWWAFQVVRMLREERIIEGYADYAARVRWRIIPQIW